MDARFHEYERLLWERGYSASTVRRRLQLWKWSGGPAMTPSSCRAVIDRPPTPETRRQYHSGMQVLIKDLRELGWLEGDPMQGWRLPPRSTYRPRPLDEATVHELLAIPGRVGEWTILGYYAALRVHEVAKIQPEQLIRSHGVWMLSIVGKGQMRDTIPAHPRVVELLRGRPSGQRLWDIQPNHLTRTWNDVARAILGEQVTFHQLRHSGISACYERSGYDLITTSRFARHRRIETTMVYADVADVRLEAAVAAL